MKQTTIYPDHETARRVVLEENLSVLYPGSDGRTIKHLLQIRPLIRISSYAPSYQLWDRSEGMALAKVKFETYLVDDS